MFVMSSVIVRLLTCIKLPHDLKTFVLSIFEWPLKTGFTVQSPHLALCQYENSQANKCHFTKYDKVDHKSKYCEPVLIIVIKLLY